MADPIQTFLFAMLKWSKESTYINCNGSMLLKCASVLILQTTDAEFTKCWCRVLNICL